MKLGIVALVAGVAGGAWLYARRDAATAMVPRVELVSPSEAPRQATVHELPAPAVHTDDLITIEPPVATPRRTSPADEAVRAVPAVRAPRDAASPPGRQVPARSSRDAASPPDREVPARAAIPGIHGRGTAAERGAALPRGVDLAREVELLDTAMAALRGGDAAAALLAVQRHAAETAGRGQLAEDAAAIEIEALCRLHDPTTSAKLEAFDARFPRSAQRSRLTSVCP